MGMVDGAITNSLKCLLYVFCWVVVFCPGHVWAESEDADKHCHTCSAECMRITSWESAVCHFRPMKIPEWGLYGIISQFWKESVGACSAHRQTHVNTSHVLDRVTVWEIFLLIFSQDLKLFFVCVPVCVNEAQCVCPTNKFLCVFYHLNTSL